MFLKIFSSRDTWITDHVYQNVRRTGSNFGSSEILRLYKIAGVSGSLGPIASSSLARILTRFDMSEISALTSSGDAPSTGVHYFLRLFDVQHDQTLPSSLDIEIQALTQDWDEGRGHDANRFFDIGYANWDKAKSNSYWTSAGASGSGPISVVHLDTGHEDVEVDVTSIVEQWLSGTLTNNGLIVRISSSQEQDGTDHFVKMFHARETSFKDKRPHLEARWNDFSHDDRSNFFFDLTGSLFLYKKTRGQYQNIVGVGTGSLGVRILDASGTLLTLTASHVGETGKYSASFAIPTSSYSGSQFYDVWFNLSSPASWYMTGTFFVASDIGEQVSRSKRYYVNVTNLRDQYNIDEIVHFDIFVRPHDYNPARVLTASLEPTGIVVTKGYYKIVNDRTEYVVAPFSTGSFEYTRLSYDRDGNYMNVHMSSFSPGNVYRLLFMFDVDGQKQYIDQGFKFRVI